MATANWYDDRGPGRGRACNTDFMGFVQGASASLYLLALAPACFGAWRTLYSRRVSSAIGAAGIPVEAGCTAPVEAAVPRRRWERGQCSGTGAIQHKIIGLYNVQLSKPSLTIRRRGVKGYMGALT